MPVIVSTPATRLTPDKSGPVLVFGVNGDARGNLALANTTRNLFSIPAGSRADTFRFDGSVAGDGHVRGFDSRDILNLTGFGCAKSAVSRMTRSGAGAVRADQVETIAFHNATLATATGAMMTFD